MPTNKTAAERLRTGESMRDVLQSESEIKIFSSTTQLDKAIQAIKPFTVDSIATKVEGMSLQALATSKEIGDPSPTKTEIENAQNIKTKLDDIAQEHDKALKNLHADFQAKLAQGREKLPSDPKPNLEVRIRLEKNLVDSLTKSYLQDLQALTDETNNKIETVFTDNQKEIEDLGIKPKDAIAALKKQTEEAHKKIEDAKKADFDMALQNAASNALRESAKQFLLDEEILQTKDPKLNDSKLSATMGGSGHELADQQAVIVKLSTFSQNKLPTFATTILNINKDANGKFTGITNNNLPVGAMGYVRRSAIRAQIMAYLAHDQSDKPIGEREISIDLNNFYTDFRRKNPDHKAATDAAAKFYQEAIKAGYSPDNIKIRSTQHDLVLGDYENAPKSVSAREAMKKDHQEIEIQTKMADVMQTGIRLTHDAEKIKKAAEEQDINAENAPTHITAANQMLDDLKIQLDNIEGLIAKFEANKPEKEEEKPQYEERIELLQKEFDSASKALKTGEELFKKVEPLQQSLDEPANQEFGKLKSSLDTHSRRIQELLDAKIKKLDGREAAPTDNLSQDDNALRIQASR